MIDAWRKIKMGNVDIDTEEQVQRAWNSPGGPVVKNPPFMQVDTGSILVGELRSHMQPSLCAAMNDLA